MSRVLTGLLAALGLLFCASSASAILIETNGGRVAGFLIADDGKTLTIRVRTKEGQEKDVEYPHAKVKILSQIDGKRLGKLSPDEPAAYRDYAKELAGMEGDPEARYVARRLYLIAAHLDPKALGPTCLLAMSALAETTSEARKCRAMAYLLDPKADAKILEADEAKSEKQARPEAAALRDFLKPLQLYRKGHVRDAADLAKRPGVEALFGKAPGKMSQRSFLGWCSDANCATCKATGKVTCPTCGGKGVVMGQFGKNERCSTCNGKRSIACSTCDGTGIDFRPSEETLRTIMRAELWAMGQLSGDDSAPAPRSSGWSSALRTRRTSPVLPLTLETITEFDPHKCYYRNRAWVARP
jgi:hypothetical protein